MSTEQRTSTETTASRPVTDRAWGVIALAALAVIVVAPVIEQWISTALSRITINQDFLIGVLFPLGNGTMALVLLASVLAIVAGVMAADRAGPLQLVGGGVALVGAVHLTVTVATQATGLLWNMPSLGSYIWF